MTKEEAIQSISGLYPADSEFPESRAFGKEFMLQAMDETGFNWRDLPEATLICYAEKCERKEAKDTRDFLRKTNTVR